MRGIVLVLLATGLTGCAETVPQDQAAAFSAARAQPFCTRTLGEAQCFENPYALPDHPSALGDTPVRTPQPEPPLWKRLADDWRME